jgi:hypothetical protein
MFSKHYDWNLIFDQNSAGHWSAPFNIASGLYEQRFHPIFMFISRTEWGSASFYCAMHCIGSFFATTVQKKTPVPLPTNRFAQSVWKRENPEEYPPTETWFLKLNHVADNGSSIDAMKTENHQSEAERLNALRSYQILDTPPGARFRSHRWNGGEFLSDADGWRQSGRRWSHLVQIATRYWG